MADDHAEVTIERLVANHHEAVYRYAFRLCGSVANAEDLSQQVFLVAQQKLRQLRSPDTAQGWLYSILRSCYLKSVQPRPQPVLATDVGLDLDLLVGPTEDEGAIDQQRLQEALDALPAEFRVVLVMFYFEECSYREIAAGLAIPMGTVMSRLARAKAHLRGRLFEPLTHTTLTSTTG